MTWLLNAHPPHATRILITIKNGCLASVCADGQAIAAIVFHST